MLTSKLVQTDLPP